MIITNVLLIAIVFLLFNVYLVLIDAGSEGESTDSISDAIKEADENERWG